MPLRIEPDLTAQLAEVIERLTRVEGELAEAQTREKNFTPIPAFGGKSGNATLKNAGEEKELAGGPEIVIPRAGDWIIFCGIRARTNVAGLQELFAGPSLNKGGLSQTYDYVALGQFDLAECATWETFFNLKVNDKITIRCKIANAVESVFDLGQLIAWQIK